MAYSASLHRIHRVSGYLELVIVLSLAILNKNISMPIFG